MLNIKTEQKDVKGGKMVLSQVPKNNIVFKSVEIDDKGVDYSKAKIAKV